MDPFKLLEDDIFLSLLNLFNIGVCVGTTPNNIRMFVQN